MERSLIRKEVAPFLLMFGALIVATTIVDGLLHFLDLVWVGRYLGIPGVLFILLSFLYSLRKRKMISFGNPKRMLQLHIALTWSGSLMILVHAGIHMYALLPWLALFAMLLNVISGMTGMYLMGRSRRFLESKKEHYRQQGLDDEAIDRKLFRDSTTYGLMKKWREVHLPITLLFAVLAVAHIGSVFLFWQWR
ncbi:MAG: hypothetical protein PVI70_17815 [Gammaproteobacteria bacterium]|jgi:hypothetical protein